MVRVRRIGLVVAPLVVGAALLGVSVQPGPATADITADGLVRADPVWAPITGGSGTPTTAPSPTPTSGGGPTPSPSPTAPPTAAPPTAAPANGSSSATAMPVGNVVANGRTWVQSYAEDFTRDAPLGTVLAKYPAIQAYDGQRDTSGQGLYAPNKVLSVSDGSLDFWMHSENNQPLVATIMPDGYAPHTTGRVSIRYRTDTVRGYKFVGMFWPSSDSWNDGEIDWPEGDLGGRVRPVSAVPGSYNAATGNMTFMPSTQQFAATTQSDWHIATTEWDKTAVRFYWDGALVASVSNAVPTKAMRVTLQAETFIGEGTVPKDTSGHVDIDWISIWN
ncbi:glycoside hydrolase family 16 protein [Curtobacterium sp. RRHDQ10]|uniref:glycoside hydrolase family 16 protein n=1 Tax=Curtobacterium phyllosphaerae TaxID=3413379 RepID=UPI003BF075A3